MSGPRFVHLDDLTWQEVRRIDRGDRTVSVREKWLDFSPAFLSLLRGVGPGDDRAAPRPQQQPRVFVLEGEMTCGDVLCRKGTHIALDQGDTFGPFVAGPHGVELFEVMMGDPRSFPADPEGYARVPRRARRAAAAEPADRHARLDRGHAELT